MATTHNQLGDFVRATRPSNVMPPQSTPWKTVSIVVAAAGPMLPNVPRQPRGDEDSPVVLIVVGGVADGAIAALPSIVLGSQGCSVLIVARKVC